MDIRKVIFLVYDIMQTVEMKIEFYLNFIFQIEIQTKICIRLLTFSILIYIISKEMREKISRK